MNGEKDTTGVVSFAAVGDIMFGDSYYCIGRGVRSTLERDARLNPFEKVSDILRTQDFVVGNLEAVLSDIGLKAHSLPSRQYRGKKEHAGYLAGANVSVLTLANNHILQHGWAAAEDTARSLRTLGIHPVGLAQSDPYRAPDAFLHESHGVRLAFLGYCLNRETFTADLVPDIEDVVAAIRSCKEAADRVILMLHWGREYVHCPSPRQIWLAHRMIDAGGDIILGHHPHVLQGIELYKGKLIAYSLGNFVFDNDWNDQCRHAMILLIRAGSDGPISYEVIPTYINALHQPVPFDGEARKRRTAEILALADEFIDNGIGTRRDEEEYLNMARGILKMNKRMMHRRIIRGLPQLPVTMAVQILAKPIHGRLVRFWNSRVRHKG